MIQPYDPAEVTLLPADEDNDTYTTPPAETQPSVLTVAKQATAEDIWPYHDYQKMIQEPSFDDYARWLAELEQKRSLLAGLNMPRSFVPRPYQVDGAVHLSGAAHGRMLYDQPGLGKTLQAAMALKPPAIISCPGYLVDQWCDFLQDQYPHWRVARIHSLLWRHQRQALLDAGPRSAANPSGYDIWVVNHEMWASRREPFKGGKEPKPKYSNAWYKWKEDKDEHMASAKILAYHWPKVKTLVLDESHHFRNREASQSQSVANFADQCDQVMCLTGTPQYRDVRDWWHQLRIMDPAKYRSFNLWFEEYCYMTGFTGNICKVHDWKAPKLQAQIAEVALGRTYKEVGIFLPDIIEYTVRVPWHPDLWKAYQQIKQNLSIQTSDGYSMSIDPGAALHTLRMMTGECPEKSQAIKAILDDLPTEDGDTSPIIVFCWYRSTAEHLAEEFHLAPSSVRIHGGYSQKERLARADDNATRIKCVTMSSASEGLDWSAAGAVVFFEEDYVPGKIYQALSRVRRWTKDDTKAPILVYYVHMKNSVDEAVHEAVTTRQGDVRKILRRALK